MLIAQLALFFLDIVFQLLPDRVASGQEHGQAPAHQLVGHKQAHFLADLPVVSGLGLLLLLDVLLQLLVGGEGNAVDPGEHLVVGVVLPVGAGLLGDLKGLQALGVGHVGADTHINIVALLVEADDGILGQVADVLLLILGVTLLHQLDGLVSGQDEGLDGQVCLDDLLHFLLDFQKVLVGELSVAEVHIVVEALFGSGAVGKVRIGIQMLDGLGHDVGGGVAQNVLLLFRGAFGNGAVFVDDFHSIAPFLSVGTQKSTPGFPRVL